MTADHAPATGLRHGTMRVFDLALGQMLWSKRTFFMAIVAGAPMLLAVAVRLAQAAGMPVRLNGVRVDGIDLFGLMIWVVFVRFVVPVLGVFYGTALIADEVEDKTLTYLFTRPVRRAAVLLGKYLAYLVCTAAVVLPSVVIVFFLLVPFSEFASAAVALARDVGVLAVGLAAYGALFALAGVIMKRPLVGGVVFAFGWEQIALALPGYLKQLTVAYYLQALVPHAMPAADASIPLQTIGRTGPSALTSLLWLMVMLLVALTLAARAVERREYVLEQ